MRRIEVVRVWYAPWRVRYAWTNTAYGTVVGYARTKRIARRRLAVAIAEMMDEL